ncbi:MAG TPA: TIGR02996 domain-containing protein [Gemmataceae bacterium]|nr:TIGR02996 domain-containing protein [Gemmataceae bacterium]
MTVSLDEAAFLATITNAPFDDAPRLVYADWLQEHDEDGKAEYLRLLVQLLHPPEADADVARCLEVAPDLDANWRQSVGGYFEVALAGAANLLWIASMFKMAFSVAFQEQVDFWQQGEPIRLQSSLTRENAESFVLQHGGHLLGTIGHGQLSFVIRPMTAETPPQLFMRNP